MAHTAPLRARPLSNPVSSIYCLFLQSGIRGQRSNEAGSLRKLPRSRFLSVVGLLLLCRLGSHQRPGPCETAQKKAEAFFVFHRRDAPTQIWSQSVCPRLLRLFNPHPLVPDHVTPIPLHVLLCFDVVSHPHSIISVSGALEQSRRVLTRPSWQLASPPSLDSQLPDRHSGP